MEQRDIDRQSSGAEQSRNVGEKHRQIRRRPGRDGIARARIDEQSAPMDVRSRRGSRLDHITVDVEVDQLHVMKFRTPVQKGAEERAGDSAAGVEINTVSALDQPDSFPGRGRLLGGKKVHRCHGLRLVCPP
jgi:hypothetical protein